MNDEKQAAAILAAAVFSKMDLDEGENPIREICLLYRRILKRMDTEGSAHVKAQPPARR
jgi:hypothetical protein